MSSATQSSLNVEVFKQYSGRETAARRVRIKCPGKSPPLARSSQQSMLFYDIEAVECAGKLVLLPQALEGLGCGAQWAGHPLRQSF